MKPLSVCGFACSDASCKWNHTLHGLLCLASLTERRVFEVHPRGNMCQCFIPFCGWIPFYYMDGPQYVYPFTC